MSWRTVIIVVYLISEVRGVCIPSDIDLHSFRIFPRRSVVYYFHVRANTCPGYTRLYYRWSMETEYETVQGVFSNTSVLKLNGYKISTQKYKPFFDIIFRVRVELSHFSNFRHSIFDVVYFRFHADHLSVAIEGGMQKTHPANKDLVLNGLSASRDLSFTPQENGLQGNKVTWEATPALNIEPPDSAIWKVPASAFQAGQTITFKMTMRRTKISRMVESVTAEQKVTFRDNIPLLMLKCIANCIDPNVQDITAFRVRCVGNCGDRKFVWNSSPDILAKENIDFGEGTDKLLLKQKVAKPGEFYGFSVTLGDASAIYGLTYMKEFEKGTCFVEPTSGVAAATFFVIGCEKYTSPYGDLTYFVYQGDAEKDPTAVMLAYGSIAEFYGIFLAEGETKITVVVRDTRMTTHYAEAGTVELKEMETDEELSDVEGMMKKVIIGKDRFTLHTFLNGADDDRFFQWTSIFLSRIPKLATETRRDLMKHIAEKLVRFEVDHIMSAEQMLSIMWKMIKAKDIGDTLVAAEMSKVLGKIAKTLFQYVSDPSENFITMTFIIDFSQKLLNVFSELLTGEEELLPVLTTETPEHDYDSYDEMQSVKITIRAHYKTVVANFLSSIELVSMCLLRKQITDQRPIELETPALKMTVRKARPAALEREIPGAEDAEARVILPQELIKSLGKYREIGYQYVFFTKNPFWWHMDRDLFDTNFVAFDFFHKDTLIREIPYYAEFRMKYKGERNKINEVMGAGAFLIYKVEVRGNTTLMVDVGTEELRVLLTDCSPTRSEVHARGQAKKVVMHRQGYQHGEMYLGIVNPGATSVDLNATVVNFICSRWDPKDKMFAEDEFETQFINSSMSCLATHLSLFGGSVGVPPNKIEFPGDFNVHMFLHHNLVMVAILLTVFILYVGLMIWAYFRDRNLHMRNIVFPLKDNVPGDEHPYLVVVVTGKQFDAGTSANVGIQLIGTESKSRPHLIQCDWYEPLQRGDEDWFVIYCPKFLGDVRAIRLWHDSSGRKPHWFCSRVMVQDLRNSKQYCFVVEKWFSLVWGDSEYSREIGVSDDKMMKQLAIIFPVTVDQSFRNGHLWLSIFASDPQNNFTTKERVSVSVCLMLLSMLSSAMFYGIPKRDPSDAIFSRGSFFVTATELWIMLESALVTIPASIILVLLFRKSGPPPAYWEKKKFRLPLPKDLKKKR
ncbi:UNVERIFIED_CONTAM: hypothetical protein PYX00_005886 [Menopon gallinae]|uniref:PLAT domain-containing protein n=1 Tax=Menopon gallinae TaxID=328185 RepID=A0AAW2HUI2_9NEOP